jgi:hypothetical protein
MKTCTVLTLLLIASLTSLGQNSPAPATPGKSPETPPEAPTPTKALLLIARSNPIETFADAFLDPNIVIGVFEYPRDITTRGLPTDQVLSFLDKYWTAQEKFGVRMMRCVKMIKGEAPIPAVFICERLAPDLPEGLQIPSFIPVAGSTWILALEKSTPESRIAQFGQEIAAYNFLEDRTLFRMFHYGYGALCLGWPEDEKSNHHAFRHVRTVPQTMVDDFTDICRVLPVVSKDQVSINDAAAIGSAWRGMRTQIGKSILNEIIGNAPAK